MIHCCWLSESDTSGKCDTDVRFLSIPAPIFSLGKLLLFYILVFFLLLEPMETADTPFSPPPCSPPLKQHQLFICIYGAQLCMYKIGLCLHGGLESSARNLSPLSCWLTQMGFLMERAQVVCKNVWHHCESWFCPSLAFEVTWMSHKKENWERFHSQVVFQTCLHQEGILKRCRVAS